MALLTPPDFLPEAMRFLVRALLALREPEIDRDELIGVVAPRGLTEAMDSVATGAVDLSDADPDDLRTGGSLSPEPPSTHCGCLAWSCSPAIGSGWPVRKRSRKSPADVSSRSMFQVLLEAVIQMADPEASRGVEDLVQALILLHVAGEPLRPFDRFESPAASRAGRSFASRQQKILGPDRKTWPVPNREQWLSFRRWASYLGLARPVGTTGLIPDASEALARRLPALTPVTTTCATS